MTSISPFGSRSMRKGLFSSLNRISSSSLIGVSGLRRIGIGSDDRSRFMDEVYPGQHPGMPVS